jgi:uroporphyrinogen-III decarboxylase
MAQNLLITVAKALAKGKLHVGTLTGLERFLLAQMALPDRVPTLLAATNVEPQLIDPRFNYRMLAESAEANLELFAKVKERFSFDVITSPTWLGLMVTGTAELGVQFQIERDRVSYPASHPIQTLEDVERIKPFTEPSGYFKMTLDIYRAAQRRYGDTLITFANDGPWDLAMLLRGDKLLPRDFRIHKDYVEATEPARKAKIRKHGDPDLWPAIMDLTTQLSIQIFKLARQHGLNMLGALMIDQFATKPVLSIDDYVNYVLPYAQRAWEALDGKIDLMYVVTSPQELEALLGHPTLGRLLGMYGYTNYIFPVTPEGITLPQYDEPMLALAKKKGKTYNYLLHGKFIRDATGQELEAAVRRICQMATEMRARLMLSVATVAPGTDLEKIDLLLQTVHRYGRY